MAYIVEIRTVKLGKLKENFKMWQILKTVFEMLFEPDSLEEQAKDKEINYERNQWGYWK